MSRIYNGTKLGAPALVHTMTKGAEAARQAVRTHATKRKLGTYATNHEEPTVPEGGWPVPGNAAKLVALAEALGYTVKLAHGFVTLDAGKVNERKAPAVQVAGKSDRRGLGFRAVWAKGKAAHGILYERGGPRTGTPVGVTAVMERVGR